MGKSKFEATDIDYDIALDDVIDCVRDLSSEEFKEIFGIEKTDEDAYDTVENKIHHEPALAGELLGLSDKLEIPDEVWKAAVKEKNCEAITDYISDETGYCINGYSLPKNLEKMIEQGKIKQEVER